MTIQALTPSRRFNGKYSQLQLRPVFLYQTRRKDLMPKIYREYQWPHLLWEKTRFPCSTHNTPWVIHRHCCNRPPAVPFLFHVLCYVHACPLSFLEVPGYRVFPVFVSRHCSLVFLLVSFLSFPSFLITIQQLFFRSNSQQVYTSKLEE